LIVLLLYVNLVCNSSVDHEVYLAMLMEITDKSSILEIFHSSLIKINKQKVTYNTLFIVFE
ncbi:MAG: hypothetical protein ACRCTW_06435, partial [Lactococcus garvieae]